MRLELILNITDKDKSTIPVNYQYPLSAWIYKTISEGNHDFATFLHNKGFITGTKSYKLFTFSQLHFPFKGFKVVGDRLTILSGECKLVLSFMVPDAVDHFIAGLFKNQRFTLGDQISQTPLIVSRVEVMTDPIFPSDAKFKCISPVIVGKTNEGSRTAEYLSPEQPDFEKILFENLIHKYSAAIGSGLLKAEIDAITDIPVMNFRLLNTPKKWGITIKDGTPNQTKIIGYTFDFNIQAPIDLIRVGYFCGFGEKNALGMGCTAVINS